MAVENETYSVKWESKPLGFSIVMDTSGKNAYVSSVQNQDNFKKGLKLASQIISINDVDVVDKPHVSILGEIKGAQTPITLVFRQRKFADQFNNEEKKKEEKKKVANLLFGSAPANIAHRVDGLFEAEKEEYNGKPSWTKVNPEDESDPIVCRWWPAEDNNITIEDNKGNPIKPPNMWLITKLSYYNANRGDSYAVHFENVHNPMEMKDPRWKCWNKETNKYDTVPLSIQAEVTGEETSSFPNTK